MGQQAVVVHPRVWIEAVLNVFSGAQVIGGALRAEQTIVGCLTDQARAKAILHAQLGHAAAFFDQLCPLERGQLGF